VKAADPTERFQVPANRYALFLLIAIAGCAADLGTKQAVFAWRGLPPNILKDVALHPQQTRIELSNSKWWLIEPYVGIQTAVNPGALFGIGAGAGRLFALLSVVAALGILVWLFRFGAARDRWLTIALACVMAGILGNLYDRMGFWYEPETIRQEFQNGVRDWILLCYGDYTWPNFNIADSMLVCGAIMLMWQAIMDSSTKPKGKSTEPKAE